MLYRFTHSTTGAISFSDFLSDPSSSNLYASQLAQATQARSSLRGALKETKRADEDEKDSLRLIKIIDDYLPHLTAIIACVKQDALQLKSEPVFSWRTTLSDNLFNNSPRINLPGLQAELASTLLTYAFALTNLASSVFDSLGSYEREPGTSDTQRKINDERLGFAATLMCRASGVFAYIAETALAGWEPAKTSPPPDLTRDVNSALSKLTLACAQEIAIRKLLSKSAYDSIVSPGPPLPASHPSPGLIAKLHIDCASLFASARQLAKTPGKTSKDAQVSAELRHYLSDQTLLHEALAHKWLGVDAGENGGEAKAGDSVAFVAWAKKDLEDLSKEYSKPGVSKRDRALLAEEVATVTTFWQHYKHANDSITFRPVPSVSDVQSRIPAGRMAVAIKAFTLPEPIFGPRQASTEDKDDRGDYAGAGAYY